MRRGDMSAKGYRGDLENNKEAAVQLMEGRPL